jgi:hypothetical protein
MKIISPNFGDVVENDYLCSGMTGPWTEGVLGSDKQKNAATHHERLHLSLV